MEACISCDTGGTTHVWSISSGQVYNTMNKNIVQHNRHGTTYVSQHQALICAQENKNMLTMYDLRRNNPLYTCAQQERINVLCSTSGNHTGYVFGGSENGRVFIWNIYSGQLIKMFDAHLSAITAICCAPEGTDSFLVTGGKDTVIHVWNLAVVMDVRTLSERKMEPLYTFSSHSLAITSLQCTRGANPKLISASMDRTCKLWDLLSGTEVCSIIVPCSLFAAVMDPSEHFLYMGGSNGRVYQVNVYPFVPRFVDESTESNRNIASGENSEFVVRQNIAFVSESTGMVGSARNLTVEHVSSLDQNKFNRNYCCVFSGHTNGITDLSLSQDGTRLVSASKDGKCLVWDTESKQILFAFKKHVSASDYSVVSASIITLSLSQFQAYHHEENVVKAAKPDQKRKNDAMYRRIKPLKQTIGSQSLEQIDPEESNEDGCSIIQLNIFDDNWKLLTEHNEFDLKYERQIPSALMDGIINPLDSTDLGYRDVVTSSLFCIPTNLTNRLHGALAEGYSSIGQEKKSKKRKVNEPEAPRKENELKEYISKLESQVEQLKTQNKKQLKINKELMELISTPLKVMSDEDNQSMDIQDDQEQEYNEKQQPTTSTKKSVLKASDSQTEQGVMSKKQKKKKQKKQRYFAE